MNSLQPNPIRFLKVNKLLLIALGLVIIYHGALLPFTVGNSYDAYIHMFFGDSYARSWFDPWEPRWYTGFTTTSYPPGTHMGIALFSYGFGLIGSFIAMMLIGLAVFVLGVYRFCLLFVSTRASGLAAIFSVVSTSVVETVHLFGQLPTIFSLGLFLNSLPHVFRWLTDGKWPELMLAVALGGATTAAHHVTTIFGTILFIGPVAIYAWLSYLKSLPENSLRNLTRLQRITLLCKPAIRGIFFGLLLLSMIILVIFPYWYWSVTDPITQVSIPHGSREDFLARLDLGLVFFVIPWGVQLFVFPYLLFKTFTSRMWPLAASVVLCFILGTGGTFALSRLLLGPAFDILTLDRFTFWATILILPFTGALLESMLDGQLGTFIGTRFGSRTSSGAMLGFFVVAITSSVATATLSTMRPTQPDTIDPGPIVNFMQEDNHDRWRYLTLGFGDQFAYISAQIDARSVDGNYHSARRLPEFVSYSVERLENSKYLGVAGLGSLQQFLVNSDRYHLKFVFSNDEFYDPLLHFSGWNRLLRLSNGIVVWEKPDVAPLPTIEPRRNFPLTHMLMWGILPPFALITGLLCMVVISIRRLTIDDARRQRELTAFKPLTSRQSGALVASAFVFIISVIGVLIYATSGIIRAAIFEAGPEETLAQYYTHLDFVEMGEAFELLDQSEGLDFETFMINRRWLGGVLASYAKLIDFSARPETTSHDSGDWIVTASYLTPFREFTAENKHHIVKRDGSWKIAFEEVRGYKPVERLQSEPTVSWNRAGRRVPIKDDLHQDILDRPILGVADARLIEQEGRYRLIGFLRNEDADPAAIKATGFLLDAEGRRMISHQSGFSTTHRLLPGQSGFFSINFEGVLSLDDAKENDAFDPTLYIPPELVRQPQTAELSVQAFVNEQNHYPGVAMTSIEVEETVDATAISVLLTNTGTEQVIIAQLQYALFDGDGRIVNVDAKFLEQDLRPGQSRRIQLDLPAHNEVTVIHDLADDEMMTNKRVGRLMQGQIDPKYLAGFVSLDTKTGYSGIALNVATMNFDPLF